jgi:hypothetical protein
VPDFLETGIAEEGKLVFDDNTNAATTGLAVIDLAFSTRLAIR